MQLFMQETLALAAPAPSLDALRSTSNLRMLRLCDASMLSNRITGKSAIFFHDCLERDVEGGRVMWQVSCASVHCSAALVQTRLLMAVNMLLWVSRSTQEANARMVAA